MRSIVSPLAERDLEAIGDHIARDDPARALRFIARLRQQCADLARAPRGYGLRPELGAGIRSCVCGRCVLSFRVTTSRLTIARILHGAMDIPAHFPDESD